MWRPPHFPKLHGKPVSENWDPRSLTKVVIMGLGMTFAKTHRASARQQGQTSATNPLPPGEGGISRLAMPAPPTWNTTNRWGGGQALPNC